MSPEQPWRESPRRPVFRRDRRRDRRGDCPLMDICDLQKENTMSNMRLRTPSPEWTIRTSSTPPTADDPRHHEGQPYLNVNSNQRGGGYETRSVKLGATSATAPRTLLYWQRSGGGRDSRDLTTRSIRRRTTIKSAVIDGYMVSEHVTLQRTIWTWRRRTRTTTSGTPSVQMTCSAGSTPNMEAWAWGLRAICIRIQYDRNNGDVLSQLKKTLYRTY
jgi:hypothetical protein